MSSSWITGFLVPIGFALLFPAVANACDRSLLRASERQMTAIVGQMRAHGCTGSETGFFSRCSGYRQSLQTLYRQAASARCDARTVPREVRQEKAARKAKATRTRQRAAAIPVQSTMCVRLSDGYLFPSPNSGFRAKVTDRDILAQCQMICETAAMDVFRIEGEERRDDTMISVSTGKPYSELPTAGVYRTSQTTARCNHAGYFRYAAMRRVRQDAGMVAEVAEVGPGAVSFSDGWRLRRGGDEFADYLPPARAVRVVGPQFFPDEESVLLPLAILAR